MPGSTPRPFNSQGLAQRRLRPMPSWVFGGQWQSPQAFTNSGATSVTLDFTNAPLGEMCFAFVALGDSQAVAPTAPSGWSILLQGAESATGAASSRLIVYTRSKQVGDTTQAFTWGTACGVAAIGMVWYGLDQTTPTEGAAYLAHSSGTTYPTASITPTAANRWIVGAFFNRTSTSTGTWISDNAMTERWAVATTANPWSLLEIADTGVAVTAAPHTYTSTSSVSSSHGGSIVFALIPATAAVAPATIPSTPRRRVNPAILQTRFRTRTPVPAQVTVAPPAFVPQPVHARLRLAKVWRGHTTTTPVPVQAPVPPAFVPHPSRARVNPAPARRHAGPPAPQGQPGIGQALRSKLRWPKPARGHTAAPTPPQIAPTPPTYPPQGLRTRIRFLRQARPQAVSPVPAQIILTPPPYVPQGLRARIRSLRLPRARTATPVPAQVVLTAPAFPPQAGRPHPRLLRYFRGRATPPPQTAQVPAPTVRARQLPGRPVRRSRPVTPPVRQDPAPLFTRIKLRAIRLFRGKTRSVVPAQIIVVPPAYPLQSVRGKKRLWSLRRRRAGMDGWLVGAAANPCVTPRPSTGTTGRPGTGTTTYLLATTTRPSTGTTTRPDTGTTEDPC